MKKSIYMGSVQDKNTEIAETDAYWDGIIQPMSGVGIPNFLQVGNDLYLDSLVGHFEFEDSNLEDVLYCNTYVGMLANLHHHLSNDPSSFVPGSYAWSYFLQYFAFYSDDYLSNNDFDGFYKNYSQVKRYWT